MTGENIEALPRSPPADAWRTRRIWLFVAFGLWLAGAGWILDFWPLGGGLGQDIRSAIDLSRLLLVLLLAGFSVGLLIAAGIALYRRQFRRAVSSVVAIAALPVCFVIVAKVPLFDPWLWYAIANKNRFETLVASDPVNRVKYAVLREDDVSTGFSGIDPNHFVLLIYDESDDVGRKPSDRPDIWRARMIPGLDAPIPKGRKLYGHFFRVDCFK